MKAEGLSWILLATLLAGVTGYLIQWIVPLSYGSDVVIVYVAFWSIFYLVVSALSGMQQEMSRATRIGSRETFPQRKNTARNFGGIFSLLIFILIGTTGIWWVPLVIPGGTWFLAFPLAFGCASYVVFATFAGTLYGLGRWKTIAILVSLDALIRLAAIAAALFFKFETVGIAWAIVVPLPLSFVIVWLLVRTGIIGVSVVDVSLTRLSWNVFRAILAGAATGVLISGFPFLVAATSQEVNSANLASFLVIVTLARAPLIVPFLALQSFLIIRFRDAPARLLPNLVTIGGGVIAATLLAATFTWFFGVQLVNQFFGGKYEISSGLLFLIVASAGLTGALCVSGAAVLSSNRHSIFTAGWVTAAGLTIIALLLPFPFDARVLASLFFPPIFGLCIHVIGLVAVRLRVAHSVSSGY